MLVLSRQSGQVIMIGDDIEVTVVDVRGEKVRLGISAPRSTKVHRKEIYDQIRAENLVSACLNPSDLLTTPLAKLENGHPSRLEIDSNSPGTILELSTAQPFMRAALDEARLSMREGGLPIGCVLVREGKIIAEGHNRRIQRGDPTAHAELDCLRAAGPQQSYRDTILYCTMMPSYFSGGAVVQFGIPRVVIGDSVNFPGAPELMKQHGTSVLDLHDRDCIEMMQRFAREHPALWGSLPVNPTEQRST